MSAPPQRPPTPSPRGTGSYQHSTKSSRKSSSRTSRGTSTHSSPVTSPVSLLTSAAAIASSIPPRRPRTQFNELPPLSPEEFRAATAQFRRKPGFANAGHKSGDFGTVKKGPDPKRPQPGAERERRAGHARNSSPAEKMSAAAAARKKEVEGKGTVRRIKGGSVQAKKRDEKEP